MSRYIIGIDLGTTNIAMAYLDKDTEDSIPEIFPISQVSDLNETKVEETISSFIYLPDDKEVPAGSLDLEWAKKRDFSIGRFARKQASLVPGKVISSSKSWLCANNVNRLEPILPWDRQNEKRQLSPVSAARYCLEHLKDAWNNQFDEKFEEQEIILTVPASFDAVARNLTVQAAEEASLKVTLIEEPQAAFYSWLQEHNDNWRENVKAGNRILVCDIGGGTTDFSLIEVADTDGELNLERIAVGNHILLGGDNLDLTLAYVIAAKIKEESGTQLDNYQLAGMTHACREA
ncbi:MAG: Hsp70 family protein, partial [Lentisphaeria bacterium]|nr:Hsp70 family protein [Lentisphaeria bacterium]NQZ70112.1 Hsp70 family protein [Lentisphaeria bacterium]